MIFPVRNTSGTFGFPVVSVDAWLGVLRSPQVTAPLYGVRRRAVDKVVQTLSRAKHNQIDGEVVLLNHQIESILDAFALITEWQSELLQGGHDGDGE